MSTIDDICRQIHAIGRRAEHADATINLAASRHLSNLFTCGPGLLEELPVKRRGGGKSKQAAEDSDDDEAEEASGIEEDDASEYEGPGDPTQMIDDDDLHMAGRVGEEVPEFTEEAVVKYLDDLYEDIVTKQRMAPIFQAPGLSQTPHPHQLRAAALMRQAALRRFRGMILADPMGGGKTLSALLAIQDSLDDGRGPCLIVVPPSCARQWMKEIAEWFPKMRAFHLDAPVVSPAELFKYDVVVVSYHFVISELARPIKFVADLSRYGKGELERAPKRPNCALTSEIFESTHARPWGKLMVLDEAHTIKNLNSRSYHAIQGIRQNFHTCVMLTGTPLDNTWKDSFSLLFLLHGHPFYTAGHMMAAFVSEYDRNNSKGAKMVPKGEFFRRYAQLMDAVTLRRPVQEISGNLQGAVHCHVKFAVEESLRTQSNDEFIKFRKSLAMARNKAGTRAKVNWGSLVRAHQYVTHPSLVDIMALLQNTRREAREREVDDDTPIEDLTSDDRGNLTAQQQAQVQQWRQKLRKHRAWRSPRVDCILDQLKQIRDVYPDDKVLIFDESVFFLDVLSVMMEETDDPIPFLRFDGRQTSAERHVTLEMFKEMPGFAVLLCTRSTGGQGLNMQMANHVVLCSPWWKEAWVAQAIARAHRFGQTKVVRVYYIRAKGVQIERYKEKTCNAKEKFNVKVMNEVERSDSAQEVQRRKMTR